MMKTRKAMTRTISVIISLALIVAAAPLCLLSASAEEGSVVFATISDVNYTASANTGDYCEEYLLEGSAKLLQYTAQDGLLESAFAAIAADAEEKNIQYLLISGDLAANGAYSNHISFSALLAEFENETGIQVIVTNGDQDVYNMDATVYSSGTASSGSFITATQFRTIYAQFGYDLACSTFSPSSGGAGQLSYAVQLDGGYRLIVIDAAKYSYDVTDSGMNVAESGGVITDELMEWILEQCAEAEECGETVIGMSHFAITAADFFSTNNIEGTVIDNYEYVSETLADAGMHYFFSGNTYISDIDSTYSDSGEVIYNIVTNSLLSYPNTFRETALSRDSSGTVTAEFETVDVDEVLLVTDAYGTTYEYPYRETGSLQNQFCDYDTASWLTDFTIYYLKNVIVPGIDDAGSLIDYIEELFGLDLEETLNDLLDGGLTVAGIAIFDGGNIMNIVEDIADQIYDIYLSDSGLEELEDTLYSIFYKIMNSEISSEACSKFSDTYGFGSDNGTLGDLLLEAFIYHCGGNEDISDDAFMQDVISTLADGSIIDDVVDILFEYLIEDFLVEDLFANVTINISEIVGLSSSSTSGSTLNSALSFLLTVFGGDSTIKGVLDVLFNLGILDDYGSDYESLVDYIFYDAIGDSALLTITQWLSEELEYLTTDSSPQEQGDYDVTYVYSGAIELEATTEDMRLPSMVTVTLGEDTQTGANITWYTRYSVTGTDIEIYEADGTVVFTGTDNSDDYEIEKTTTETTRTYAGIDGKFLDLYGEYFLETTLIRHDITISGLEAGTTYYYRIGDAEKDWWSETGSITTADGSDSVTFLHMTDNQGTTLESYAAWLETLEIASSVADYDFILNTGDFVDNGSNTLEWQYCLDIASEYLMSTFLMPVTGDHDADGDYAIQLAFNLPYVSISTESGVCYSFDYNNIHIAVINTNDLNKDDELTDEQVEWLTEDIASSDADWYFVAFHNAIYSDGAKHSDDDETIALREQLCELMTTLGIDVVFNGNDHVYMRTDALENGTISDTASSLLEHADYYYATYVDPDGTIYVVSGAAGSKYYTALTDNSEYYETLAVSMTISEGTFSVIEVEGDTLYFTAYSGTTVIDRFAIQKYLSYSENYYELGDVNLDGSITLADARLALQAALLLTTLTDLQLDKGDIDGDDRIETSDARAILQYTLGLSESL